MRAAVVRTLGQPPEPGEHPDPAPAQGQAVVTMTAAPLVPLDLLCASGTSYFGRPPVPYVPGVQGVGRVEQSAFHAPGISICPSEPGRADSYSLGATSSSSSSRTRG